MFWTKVAQFGPPGTPQKSAFFQESGRKRMKEWHQVTFTKEWMNALDDTRILAPTHFQNLVSFPRYGRLKKKCWYKLICNGTYWLLLTGHFGLVFIRPSQWSITAVRPSISESNTLGPWGKTHLRRCRPYLGIAQIAITPPAPHSNVLSGALFSCQF